MEVIICMVPYCMHSFNPSKHHVMMEGQLRLHACGHIGFRGVCSQTLVGQSFLDCLCRSMAFEDVACMQPCVCVL